MTKPITTVIIHKLPVLAATTKIGTFAKTFANRTQAENAAAKSALCRAMEPPFLRRRGGLSDDRPTEP